MSLEPRRSPVTTSAQAALIFTLLCPVSHVLAPSPLLLHM